MNVFITGGTGYFGSALVEHLISAGHRVIALARSEHSANQLREAGAVPVRGSLSDTATLTEAAEDADAVVWAASDYTLSEESIRIELGAVAALTEGAGAARSNKPFLYTSTGLVYGSSTGKTAEDAVLPSPNPQSAKLVAERMVLDAAGVTGIVFRAGLIFGRGGTLLLTSLIQAARTHGVSTYVDAGVNTWRPIHIDDLTELYLRALATPQRGIYNAVGTVEFSFRGLAEAIGELTGTPAVSIPRSVAEQTMGPAAEIITSSSAMDAEKARTTFNWAPSGRSLLDDVRHGSYARA